MTVVCSHRESVSINSRSVSEILVTSHPVDLSDPPTDPSASWSALLHPRKLVERQEGRKKVEHQEWYWFWSKE